MNRKFSEGYFLRSRIFWHILFWLCIWALLSFLNGMGPGFKDYLPMIGYQAFVMIGRIIITYFTLYFLVPRFLLKKKYVSFIVSTIISILVVTLIQRALNLFIYYPYLANTVKYNNPLPSYWDFKLILSSTLFFYPVISLALCIKIIKNWYLNQQKLQQAEKEQLVSELKFLQSQIHPHFFFNTLNNLYGLALQNSGDTAKAILRLSELMRYMLYETTAHAVPLEKELQHISNYIELEKIRYKESFEVFFKLNGHIENKMMAPLLLLPFVENAFKHGFGESVKNAWLSIDVDFHDSDLHFIISNSIPSGLPENQTDFMGLGLQNVKRRLELLYPNNHQLKIKKGSDRFSANLIIKLENNL